MVDLPDVVGHPAFPATMEHLVRSNGGTVLDAARAALAARRGGRTTSSAARRLLAPLIPTSLRSADVDRRHAAGGRPRRRGSLARGARAGSSSSPKIAAVLGAPVAGPLTPGASRARSCSATRSMATGSARDASGDPDPDPEGVPVAIGPCIVSGRRARPADAVRHGPGRRRGMGEGEPQRRPPKNLLPSAISRASTIEALEPAEAFAIGSVARSARFEQRSCGRAPRSSSRPRASGSCATASAAALRLHARGLVGAFF